MADYVLMLPWVCAPVRRRSMLATEHGPAAQQFCVQNEADPSKPHEGCDCSESRCPLSLSALSAARGADAAPTLPAVMFAHHQPEVHFTQLAFPRCRAGDSDTGRDASLRQGKIPRGIVQQVRQHKDKACKKPPSQALHPHKLLLDPCGPIPRCQ